MTVYTVFGQSGGATVASDTATYTMGMMFSLSSSAALTGIWFNSPSGATVLPVECLIESVTGNGNGAIVSGTDNTSPSWSGAAGSGWIKCSYPGTTTLLASTNYKVCVRTAGGGNFYGATAHYWDTGTGSGGITNGIITAPNNATAQANDGGGAGYGQDTFNGSATLAYPGSSFNSSNYWIDVEVTTGGAAPTIVYQMRMMP